MIARSVGLALVLLGLVMLADSSLPYQCGTFAPDPVPPMTDSQWELRQVSIVFRHGDRIMWGDFPCWPNDQGVFQCQDRHLSTPSFLQNQTLTNTNRVFRRTYMENRNYYPGNCETGQLTNKGFVQEQATGAMYRNTYVHSGFLPSEFDPSLIYLRSDMDDRCMQSLETMLDGFFPSKASKSQLNIYDINTLDKYYDNIAPNSNICPLLNTYEAEALKTPEYQQHYQKYTLPLYNALSAALGSPVKDDSTFEQIHDCLIVHACHQQPIPAGVNATLFEEVMAEFEYRYETVYNYPSSQENAQAGIGYLLQEINQYWEAVVSNSTSFPQYKLTMWSGHDTTLVPLLVAFQQWTGVWAHYASQIQFELYQSTSTHQFAMRVNYNGESLTLPGCGGTICDWNTFSSFVQSLFPTGTCQRSSAASARTAASHMPHHILFSE